MDTDRPLKVLIIVCCLPVLTFPWMLGRAPEDGSVELFLWLYPVYVVISAYCEWLCAGSRNTLVWILMILMLLTHGAMWMLVLQ